MEFDRPIAAAITLFATLVFAFFLTVPKYKDFRVLQAKLAEKEAEFDSKFAYYSEIAKAYEQLEAHKNSVEKIKEAIPDTPLFGPLVYFFQKKAVESGLVARGVFLTKASSVSPESNMKEIIFSLDLLGGYSAFKNFMAALEKSARLFEIVNISFSSSSVASVSKQTGPPKNQAPVIMQTYPFELEVKAYSY